MVASARRQSRRAGRSKVVRRRSPRSHSAPASATLRREAAVPEPPSGATTCAASAIARIKDEHLALASVLYGLRHAVAHIRDNATPDFRLLFALVDYIRLFPDRLHHPKEDEYLFPALTRRCAEARPLVAELEAEHARGNALIASLDTALDDYARDGAIRFEPFAAAVESYAAFHWQHMGKEEEVLLPLAQRHLTADDWARVDAAFRASGDPLADAEPKAHAEALFRCILELVPSRRPDSTPRSS